MGLETRVWRTGYDSNLLTTVPKAVREQLGLQPPDRIRWTIEGGYARVTRATLPAGAAPEDDPTGTPGPDAGPMPAHLSDADGGTTYRLYKQTRGNSLYTSLPAAVVEQLRFTDRSRVEWELQGGAAHVRRA